RRRSGNVEEEEFIEFVLFVVMSEGSEEQKVNECCTPASFYIGYPGAEPGMQISFAKFHWPFL
ncbi:MAG: hypothetical protein ACRC7H_06635, partial [Plesiomonas shigelloides]